MLPDIYLDIDGTLIHESMERAGEPAAGLADFIRALRPYRVLWLTTHCMDGNQVHAQKMLKRVLDPELHPDIDRIIPTSWSLKKTTGIDLTRPFIWFDNDIFDEERKDIAEAGPGREVVEVNLDRNPDQLIEITRDIFAE